MTARKASLDNMSIEQRERLLRFIRETGTDWKDKLNRLWWTGQDASLPDGHLLRQIRNQLGPVWLAQLEI